MEEEMEDSEVMVLVDEELVDTIGMDLQETNTKRKNLFVHHILEIQVGKDGNSKSIFEHLKNSDIIQL